MLAIPALDIMDGKCVRLEQGQFDRIRVYNYDAIELAQRYHEAGATRLHLVDLDGARTGRVVNWRVLEKLCDATPLFIDFGGGIATDDDLRVVQQCGARQVTVGSLPVKNPPLFEKWVAAHGPDYFILAADVWNNRVRISGWQEDAGLTLPDFLEQFTDMGITHFLCTDIAKDGLLQGPSLPLYQHILEEYPKLKLIASGGVSSLDDLKRLQEAGLPAVVIGKALLEEKVSAAELKPFFKPYTAL